MHPLPCRVACLSVSQADLEKDLAYAVAIESDVEEWID